MFVEPESVASGFRVSEGLLEGAEEASGPRDSQGHGPQLTQDLVPSFGGNPALGGFDAGQDVMEPGDPVWWQLNCQLEGVQQPAQHYLSGGPSGISLAAFLDGGRLLPVGTVSWGQRLKNVSGAICPYQGALPLTKLPRRQKPNIHPKRL